MRRSSASSVPRIGSDPSAEAAAGARAAAFVKAMFPLLEQLFAVSAGTLICLRKPLC